MLTFGNDFIFILSWTKVFDLKEVFEIQFVALEQNELYLNLNSYVSLDHLQPMDFIQ